MKTVLSTHDIAVLLGTDDWRVRRLFEDGSLPEPERFAGKRLIPGTLLPAVVDALRHRGWLPKPVPTASASGRNSEHRETSP